VAFVVFAPTTLSGQANATSNGVPAGVANAKSVFISNGGSDGGLFPEPFSGDPNRAYFGFVKALQDARLYDQVDDPAQADVVMQIQLSAPTGPVHTSKQLGSADFLPFFKLIIFDRKTHYILWTITEPIEFAFLQKTHDKNFDGALGKVLDDLQALSKPGSALYPHPPARQSSWTQ
jgi:hypothetical protein